jgi:hypothetical protein
VESGEELDRAAGEPKESWIEPEAQHVGVSRLQPEACEEPMVAFFDRHLLGK